jgi:hypothetical protein
MLLLNVNSECGMFTRHRVGKLIHAPQYCGGTSTDAELFDCARLDGVSTEGSDATMDSLTWSRH